jgi:cytochrome P450
LSVGDRWSSPGELHPSRLDDPYPTYARLRDRGPLHRMGPATWAVTRHADVYALLRDERLGGAHELTPDGNLGALAGTGPAAVLFQRSAADRRGPDHALLRGVLERAIGARALGRVRDRARDAIDELLAGAGSRGSLDVVPDLAQPLQALAFSELLGLRDRDHVGRQLRQVSEALAPGVGEAERSAAAEAMDRLRGHVRDLVEADGVPDRDGIVESVLFLLLAGYDLSLNGIASGCDLLIRHPDAADRLRADRSLVPAAVEELLRYETLTQTVARRVAEPIEIGGQRIGKGRVLLLLLGSANRDERQFPEPDVLDVGRKPNPHVAFGGGAHHCLGAGLVRMELALVLERLLAHFRALEPAGPAIRLRRPTLRAFSSVPMRVAR